jgi:hypothetical protein
MAIISLNRVNQLIFVMVKGGVLFEVRTGFLYTVHINFQSSAVRLRSISLLAPLSISRRSP